MARIDGATEHQTREKVWIVVKRHPNGISTMEVAADLDMERRTVDNYLAKLGVEGRIYKEGTLWFSLPYEELKLRPFDISPEEAFTLYLATRLFTQQQDKRNEPALTALMKLADVMRGAANVSGDIQQAVKELQAEAANSDYQKVYRALIQGYLYRRQVEIVYQPAKGREFTTRFEPYLFEPSAVGLSTYVIGYSHASQARRTYKLERIHDAKLRREDYSIPADFPGLEILRNSWSIMLGNEQVEVVLRFSPAVRARVLETRWHPSQQTGEDSEKPGWLRFSMALADTLDLLPWVKGWGADCEVVAPKDLRDRLAGEARRLGELYGTNRPPTIELRHQRLLQCWGKTVDKSEEYHPAIFHMIDVANVALALLEGSSENRYRWILQRAFNTNVGELWKWIPWIVGLHDVGKISLPFQQCNPVQKQRLERNGFHMTGWAAKDRCPHSLVSEIFLTKLLHDNKQDAFNSRTVMLAEAVGGHHGSYLRQKQINLNEVKLEVSEHPEWQQLRLEAADILKELFLKIDPSSLPEPENVSVALAALTGFMILCDWIGSDSRFFSPVPEMSVEEYRQISRRRAQEAIEMFGVNEATVITQRQTFSELFVDISQPRPLQLAVDKIPQELLDTPSLVVLEAPTGEGKTEAALAIAHRIASARPHADFYYALPTTATSNQMFLRLQRYVREQLHLPSEVKLVHGQSFLIEEKLRIAPMRNEEGTENESSSLEWFMGKKRALLAPFGVGTVDQAELGALNVRHAVLRLFGLAGKVVIIDEIHAYDIYMTTIISQLLQWLAMMGTSVILLSATLPTERRRNLITAYCGSPGQIAETSVNEYPLLVVATQNAVYLDAPPAWQTDRTLNLAFLQFNVDDYRAQAGWLLDAVIDGGCACWITNIVGRSQKLFTEIQNLAAERLLDIDLLLLHSQFPLYKRQELEQEVVSRYGKDGNRPIRGIVIGTQVLEQSLDLDFDIMVSDLAPIDLMLQRAGRLHRHLRQRPPAHSEARLWVHDFNFTTTDALPRGDIHVYSEYILRLTHGCIRNRIQLSLPKDFRTLVEEVYSAEPPTESDPLFSAWKKLKQEQDAAAQCASERLLPRPNAETPFSISSTDLEFIDDENSSGWLVAMTRLGDVSINVIPLEVRTRMAILKSGDVVSLDRWADRTTALQILEHGLRVSNRDLIEALESVETVPLVRDTSLLRNHVFLKLEEGKAHLKSGKKSITCILDPHLGLVVTKD